MELDKLDKVAMLARSQESRAAGTLQRSQQALDQSAARRSQLEQFKQEYEQRLQAMASTGMDARQLADYRLFLRNLNDAISHQDQEVSRSEAELETHREALVDRSLRRSSVDELVNRGRLDLLRETDKQEQKQSDEMSLQRHDSGA
ncbi:flagellar export protein FliJ [Congregibacter litoralis]|uniref:Flagellar FliJ protein n=1 Tax=Congregibacter litoralis KT71 TaxID=314285 RepID=A4A5Z2_9GAMM|nr:flagellar export protein FliJ [Congregibacter litoralis]EAQ98439.1 flagellar export protein FliJ [Congregibacter litoralis KT71]